MPASMITVLTVIILLLLLLILLQFLKIRKLKKKLFDPNIQNNLKRINIIRNAKHTDIDMHNIVNSINKADSLYKQLSLKYHPDRFANTDLHAEAEQLFKRITKNKRNYQKLLLLKHEAEKQLTT